MLVEALAGSACTGLIPAGKSGPKNPVIAIPAMLVTYPCAPGVPQKGAFIQACIGKASARADAGYLMPSGLSATDSTDSTCAPVAQLHCVWSRWEARGAPVVPRSERDLRS